MEMSSKEKGALAELAVASDLQKQGHHIALPFGDYRAYDLVLERPYPPDVVPGPRFERVQVKYTKSDGDVIQVKARSHSVNAGKVVSTRYYGPDVAEWVAIYDATTDRCYYFPTDRLLVFKSGVIHLRIKPPKNGQEKNIRWAKDYTTIESSRRIASGSFADESGDNILSL